MLEISRLMSILMHFRTQHCALMVHVVDLEDECGEEICAEATDVETSGEETSGVEMSGGETSGGETSASGVKMAGVETVGGETSGGETFGVKMGGVETAGGETTGEGAFGVKTAGVETSCRESFVGMLPLCYCTSTSDSQQVVVYPSPSAYSTPRSVLPLLLQPNACSTASPSDQYAAPCSDLG